MLPMSRSLKMRMYPPLQTSYVVRLSFGKPDMTSVTEANENVDDNAFTSVNITVGAI